jgi:aspartyl-tRNA(Asn)/glutamyl-tRNA(Gln) amidotransferase subunit B
MAVDDILSKYDVTIGVECHVQLATDTKLFSGADNDERDKSPNSVVSPIDFGLPGMLPVLNRRAVDLAIKAGKALNSPIAKIRRFDRKHYFYPDLPKGYQITQMYQPIIGPGVINVPMENGYSFDVRINHAHMEEDAGKLTHHNGFSLVDLNRAGTPLIEIVTEPDIHSSLQAKAFAIELFRVMTYAGVTRGDLYHGNMRFDVNISTAPKGSGELGTRTEVKNLNSFRSVERASEYEFRRQVELLERGEKIVQETRGWDENKQKTTVQRSKEDSQDYRYMPDADIPPVVLSDEEIRKIQDTVPALPPFYRNAWKDIGFDPTVINALLASRTLAELVQRIYESKGENAAKRVGLWYVILVNNLSEDESVGQNEVPIKDEYLIELSDMVEAGELSSTAAKKIFLEINRSPKNPRAIASEMNLLQVSDESEIIAIVEEVLADKSSERAISDLRKGNEKVIGFLVGQVMRKSGGKANPALVQKIIKQKIKSE